MRDRLGGKAFVAALMALALAAGAHAEGVEIRDVMKVGVTSGCTITISPRDHSICAGSSDSVMATVDCGSGYVQIRSPEWFLDGNFIGSGNGVRYTAGEGTHVVMVSCGSCTDQIQVTVLPPGSCTYIPVLQAAYADSAVESTTGIFQQPNIAAVNQGNFRELKFLMRPVTLLGSAEPLSGGYILRSTGTNLQLFRADGTQIALPDTVSQSQLPLNFLLNATATGTTSLIATYDSSLPGGGPAGGPGEPHILTVAYDTLKVRVGQFPGLAGKSLGLYPWFEFMRSVNDSASVQVALDPTRHAERHGLTYRIYVVAHKTPAQWALDNSLVDVTGGYKTATVTPGSITANTSTVWAGGLDGGPLGMIGKPYDVVFDFGADGHLDPGDLVDGLDYSEAGFYVVRSLTVTGPHSVVEVLYSGGTWLGQDLYYPADVSSMGQLPLVVVSHGNGHVYTWYDYIGYHMASYGYIVMSHENNTGPGIETASTTTITNTDYFLGNLASIAGGVLQGHVDNHHITWIGHSRGGEGVCRAYDRVYEGQYVPTYFVASDIQMISSIAPTVFLSLDSSDPHDRNYDLIWGTADNDVSGDPSCTQCESQRILEHAQGNFVWTEVEGATHNDFHNGPEQDAPCSCPFYIGKDAAQTIAKSYWLALLEWFIKGSPATKDYLTHMWDDFRTTGTLRPQDNPPGLVAVNYKDSPALADPIIDDYQTNTGTNLSSSGGTVTYDVSNLTEADLNGNSDFTWTTTDPMNGCENMESGDLSQKGVAFDWTLGDQKSYEEAIVPAMQNMSGREFLSLRVCQGTRHPETVGLAGPLYFTVELRDAAGHTSAIPSHAYGTITQPYQRSGSGTGAGWVNQWHTVRIRLADFENDNSRLDLTHIVAVKLKFGSNSGSNRGRLAVDQLELPQE